MNQSRHHRLALVYTIVFCTAVLVVSYWQLQIFRANPSTNISTPSQTQIDIDLGAIF